MAYVVDDNGDYVIDGSGNYVVDDAATLTDWLPDVDPAAVSATDGSTAVATVAAVGLSAVTFSLSGVDAALFSIGSASGVLTFDSAPSYETPLDADLNNVYLVTVTATNAEGSDARNLAITVADMDIDVSGVRLPVSVGVRLPVLLPISGDPFC